MALKICFRQKKKLKQRQKVKKTQVDDDTGIFLRSVFWWQDPFFNVTFVYR